MINLKRILFPTDFSENAKVAQTYACAFAEQFGAELHLLHVYQDVMLMAPEPASAYPLPANYLEEILRGAQQALEQVLDPKWAEGKRVIRATRQGSPFVEIVRYAKEHDIDLIVLGTHGRSALMHVLLGSVAERVVRKAPCPVLTVRPTDHKFVMP